MKVIAVRQENDDFPCLGCFFEKEVFDGKVCPYEDERRLCEKNGGENYILVDADEWKKTLTHRLEVLDYRMRTTQSDFLRYVCTKKRAELMEEIKNLPIKDIF